VRAGVRGKKKCGNNPAEPSFERKTVEPQEEGEHGEGAKKIGRNSSQSKNTPRNYRLYKNKEEGARLVRGGRGGE